MTTKSPNIEDNDLIEIYETLVESEMELFENQEEVSLASVFRDIHQIGNPKDNHTLEERKFLNEYLKTEAIKSKKTEVEDKEALKQLKLKTKFEILKKFNTLGDGVKYARNKKNLAETQLEEAKRKLASLLEKSELLSRNIEGGQTKMDDLREVIRNKKTMERLEEARKHEKDLRTEIIKLEEDVKKDKEATMQFRETTIRDQKTAIQNYYDSNKERINAQAEAKIRDIREKASNGSIEAGKNNETLEPNSNLTMEQEIEKIQEQQQSEINDNEKLKESKIKELEELQTSSKSFSPREHILEKSHFSKTSELEKTLSNIHSLEKSLEEEKKDLEILNHEINQYKYENDEILTEIAKNEEHVRNLEATIGQMLVNIQTLQKMEDDLQKANNDIFMANTELQAIRDPGKLKITDGTLLEMYKDASEKSRINNAHQVYFIDLTIFLKNTIRERTQKLLQNKELSDILWSKLQNDQLQELQLKEQTLNVKLQELQLNVKTLNAQLQELQLKKQTLNAELQKSQAGERVAREKLDELQHQYQQTLLQMEKLSEDLDLEKIENTKVRTQLSELHEQFTSLKEEQRKTDQVLATEREKLTETIRRKEANIAALEDKLHDQIHDDALMLAVLQKAAVAEAKIVELRSELEQTKAKPHVGANFFAEIKEQLDREKLQLSLANNQIEALKAEKAAADLQSNDTSLVTTNAELHERVARVETDNAALKHNNDQLMAVNQALLSHNSQLGVDNATLVSENADLVRRLTKVEEKSAVLKDSQNTEASAETDENRKSKNLR